MSEGKSDPPPPPPKQPRPTADTRAETDAVDHTAPPFGGAEARGQAARLDEALPAAPARKPRKPARARTEAAAETTKIRARAHVQIQNRHDPSVLAWMIRLYGFIILGAFALLTVAAVAVYSWFSLTAPATPDLKQYASIAGGVSHIYAADGTQLGEYAKEWRKVTPFEKIPKQLVNAFLAVEDHEFFEHRGIYFKGIARALWANITAGDFAQGGSTITQQVAKQFIGGEKSLARKGREAVMARRLEAKFSKRAILSVYLNHIYLGGGAWGVAGAAQRYFQKDLDQLTLAESAMIAGLAKAPTRFSPINQVDLAIERRNVVLDKMQTYGFATAADVTKAKAEPIRLNLYKDLKPDRMPYYTTYVQGYVTKKYGDDALFRGGLTVETAAEPTWEAAAYENVDFAAHNQDKRQGWRGPEWRLDGEGRDRFVARQKKLYGNGPLVPGKRYLGIVDSVVSDGAKVVIGERTFDLPLRNMNWAVKWQPGNQENDQTIGSATSALKAGDVIWVKREVRSRGRFRAYGVENQRTPGWLASSDDQSWDASHEILALEQVPHPQTMIFTADHETAYVVTMAGGYDFDRSFFNRATQACRPPGSTYKPIYYSLGLDQGYGFDTRLDDRPVQFTDAVTGEVWSPTNLGETMDGDVTLEYALVFSKNIPSVDLFVRLGADNVVKWARQLGFTTKIFADEALALGASCSKPEEMARAYSVFSRNGKWWPKPAGEEKSWVYVRRILDRDGNEIENNTVAEDPQLPAEARYDRLAAVAGIQAQQAIPARAAYLTAKLLAEEVRYGFASVVRSTQLHAAGKTGTSSDTFDTWFIAFTSRFTTITWMGDDKRERALGMHDAAYITVVPLWARYMYEAAKNYPNPELPWTVPPGVDPKDRGAYTKGERAPQMDLVFRPPPKKADDAGGDAALPL